MAISFLKIKNKGSVFFSSLRWVLVLILLTFLVHICCWYTWAHRARVDCSLTYRRKIKRRKVFTGKYRLSTCAWMRHWALFRSGYPRGLCECKKSLLCVFRHARPHLVACTGIEYSDGPVSVTKTFVENFLSFAFLLEVTGAVFYPPPSHTPSPTGFLSECVIITEWERLRECSQALQHVTLGSSQQACEERNRSEGPKG